MIIDITFKSGRVATFNVNDEITVAELRKLAAIYDNSGIVGVLFLEREAQPSDIDAAQLATDTEISWPEAH